MKAKILMARVLTSMVPEEKLVDQVLKELEEYKKKKFGETKKETKKQSSSLKDFFKGSTKEEKSVEVEPPAYGLMGLLIKWSDEGKDISDILTDDSPSPFSDR